MPFHRSRATRSTVIESDIRAILRRFPSKAGTIVKLDRGSEMFRLCCRDHLVISERMSDRFGLGVPSWEEERFLRRRRLQVEAEIRGMIEDFEIR